MADPRTAPDRPHPPLAGPAPTTSPREALVVRTRFVPPKLRPQILARPRVDAVLARAIDFPITVVRAEAGYGKTTAVAAYLAGAGHPYVWYNVGDIEADPQVFLLHLIHALRTLHPDVGARALARLSQDGRSPRVWNAAVDALSNDLLDRLTAETVLVIDDYDRVNSAGANAVTERLVETMPPLLHLVVTARTMPSLRSRARWRASVEMLEVTRAELAFCADEVGSLFARRLSAPPSAETARAVAAETEGWAIALQMLSDSVGDGADSSGGRPDERPGYSPGHSVDTLDSFLRRIPGPAELLFDYLAEEVFTRQPPDVRRFLGESACLRRLDPDACDHALDVRGSAEVLRALEQRSLFVTSSGAFRYHNLFNDFLLRRSGVPNDRRDEIHRRAAAFYRARGDDEEAVHHLLEAGQFDAVADALARIAGPMAESGRHRALGAWLDRLPPAVLAGSPELLVARGETHRLASRYAEAQPAYERARALFRARGDRAGEVRAIRGQALVYLDTVQPARATPLLREARRLTRGDRAERLSLFLLLAENTLNAGDMRGAERLYRAAHRAAYRADAPAVDPRLFVRDGRIREARQAVEANRRAEAPAATRLRAPRSHREPAALLAWCEALAGDAAAARQHASESLEVGRTLGSPTVECVSLSRLAVGWLCGHDYDPARARALCHEALRAAERIGVARFRAEPLMALTVIHGLEGNADDAESAARESLAIVDDAGDRYLREVTTLALGGALTLCERPRAEEVLLDARRQAAGCGDRLTACTASLWLALLHGRAGRAAPAREAFAEALGASRRHGYEFLFHGGSLLAPRDVSPWRGMLRRAQEHPSSGDYARLLARQLDPAGETADGPASGEALVSAPLYVQTLGPFRVWRRGQEVERTAWAREKALHLFQLLLCHRGRPLHREQIMEALWPDGAPSTAATGLRVALNALRHALEPDRASGADGQFVRRDGDAIHLAAGSGLRVDADEFTRLLKSARALEATDAEQSAAVYETALALYRGEFLSGSRYAEWAEAERQQRRGEFLAAAERLAGLLLRADETARAARWAEQMLEHDPLWEAAYAILMEAHWRQGNRALAVRAYDRCRKRLRGSLGVSPSGRTRALYERIARPEGGAGAR